MRIPNYFSLLTLILYLNSYLGSSLEAYDNRILSQDPETVLVAQSGSYGPAMVLTLQDGGFLVAWQDTWLEGLTQTVTSAIFGKIYNSDRTNRTSTITFIQGEFNLGTYNLRLALFENGNIFISYSISSSFYGAIFSPDGTKIKDSIYIGVWLACDPSLILLKNQRLLLVSCNNMYLSDSTGTSFQLRTDAVEDASSKIVEDSTIPLDSGGFMVFYTTYPQTYNHSLYGKFYDSNGNAIGQKFFVGTRCVVQ